MGVWRTVQCQSFVLSTELFVIIFTNMFILVSCHKNSLNLAGLKYSYYINLKKCKLMYQNNKQYHQ